MEAVIGKVQGFDGEFFAKDSDGGVVALKNGDSIVEGMTVFGGKDNPQDAYINIAMLNTGELLVISGVGEQLFDSSMNRDEVMDAALAEESISAAEDVLTAVEDSEKSAEDGGKDDETAAGEEENGQTTDGREANFLDRDGDATDVNTDLRDAEFDAATNAPQETDIIPEVDYIPVAGESFATVDDDGLWNGNNPDPIAGDPDHKGDDDANIDDNPLDTSEASFSGTLNFTATGDLPVTVDFAAMDGRSGTVGTEMVSYSWDAVTGVLTATVDGGYRDGQPLFVAEVTDASTGDYRVELLDNILHPSLNGEEGDDTENNVVTALTFTVTDNNGSTANGTLSINFDDDMPTIDVGLSGAGSSQGIIVSQGDGVVVAQGNIVPEGNGTSVDQWSFTHNGGPLTIDMLSEFSREINGDGVQSAVDTYIYLLNSNGNLVASNDDHGGGADGSTNSLDSYLSFGSLAAGEYTLSVGDYHLSLSEAQTDQNDNDSPYYYGDSAYGVGPYQITFTGDIENVYQADGTQILTTQDADTIGTNSDTATASFASAFTLTQDMGADDIDEYNYDGPQRVMMHTPFSSLTYALSVTTADSGLTSEGESIILSVNGAGVIEGRTSATEPIFTVSVNPLTGEVTLTQNSEIDHVGEADDGDSFNNDVNNLGLVAGNVVLTASATITDADGDTATDSQDLDISSSISFDDDVPNVDVALLDNGDFQLPTLTTQDAETIGTDSDTATAAFASAFTLTQDTGADDLESGDSGVASLSYALSVPTADSGLTSEGESIILSVNGAGVIEGRTSATEPIFTVSVNPLTGEVTLTQNSEIDHVGEADDGDSFNNDVNNLGLVAGNVVLTASATITDDDGDTATDSQSLDISSSISFDDDVPSISENAMVQLDDDTLPDGIAGGVGDDVEDTLLTGTLGHIYGADADGTVLLLDTGAPTGFTYDLSVDGETLTIYQGDVATGTAVVEVTLSDATSGNYTVKQLAPIAHTAGFDENNVEFTMNYQVTDFDGDTVNGSMNINVDDDTPIAEDSTVEVDLAYDPVNLVFTLDISGSMGNGDGSRLELAKDAIENLVQTYTDEGIDTLIQVNTFDTTASGNGVWMTPAQLGIFLDPITAGGWTNYEDAVQVTAANFAANPPSNGAETYAYFLSDGNPTVEMNDSTTYPNDVTNGNQNDNTSTWIDAPYLAAWNTFAANISNVYAVGIGPSVSPTELAPLVDDPADILMVTDPDDLSETLEGTAIFVTGDLDFSFGADGAADGVGGKPDGDNLAFTWDTPTATDSNGDPVAISWNVSTDGLTIEGTIGSDVVVRVVAEGIDTGTPTYKITALDRDAGIADLDMPYTVTDADGDSQTASLEVDIIAPPVFIVGSDNDDVDGSSDAYTVKPAAGPGVITGDTADDILVGDPGGINGVDFNIVLTVDVSGSMDDPSSVVPGAGVGDLDGDGRSNTSMDITIQALLDLVDEYNQAGSANINLISFNGNEHFLGTYTIGNNLVGGDKAAIDSVINNLSAGGRTSYTDALNASTVALNAFTSPADNTLVYFLSDGVPTIDGGSQQTTAINNFNATVATQGAIVHAIGFGGASATYLNQFDNTPGSAQILTDTSELGQALQDTTAQLVAAGSDTLVGSEGDDLIFGDVMNTDILAANEGLSTADGSGWEVFRQLEDGQGSSLGSGWTRADTLNYIEDNVNELAVESGRDGGNDTISAGAGNDIIFGQEGDDTIDGGAGNDIIFGQEGDDTIDGGAGNDIIDGGAGADEIHGGSGDDAIVFDANDTIIDGGDGIDTLVLTGETTTIDFSDPSIASITNIEEIDMTAVEAQTLDNLHLDDVVDMTSGIDNGIGGLLHSLEITGDTADTVNLNTSGWTQTNVGAEDNGNGTLSYEFSHDFSDNSLLLTVDDQIDTVM